MPELRVFEVRLALCALALLLVCAGAAPAFAQDPLVADMRIHVGPDGSVLEVVPDEAVPVSLHGMLRDRVSKWTFSIPTWHGRPVSTWTPYTLWLQPVPTTTGGFALRVVAPGLRILDKDAAWVAPVYPASQMRRGIGGTFVYEVEIGSDGTLADVRLRIPEGKLDRDQRKLDDAAQTAIRANKWTPGMVDGVPTTCRVIYPVVFTPPGQASAEVDVRSLRESLVDLCPWTALETAVIGTLL